MTKKTTKPKTTEVTASFSMKLNLGNFENADIFCSQKVECLEKDADEVFEKVHEWCKNRVVRAIGRFKSQKLAARELADEEAIKQELLKSEV